MSDGRVEWPRFDVVVTRYASEGRARYCVVDHLSKTHRFPVDPFNREQAGDLCRLLRLNATEKGEPVTVLRPAGAVHTPPRPKRERPTLPAQKGGTGG